MKLLHTGTIQNGKMQFDNRTMLDHHIKELEGKRFGFELGEEERKKTQSQLGYLWGVIYPLAIIGFAGIGEPGLDKDEVHRFFKLKFLKNGRKMVDPETGELKDVDPTTKTLITTEMNQYMEDICRFCADFLNTIIPLPDKNWKLKTHTYEQ